jgi:transposase InsO family protein
LGVLSHPHHKEEPVLIHGNARLVPRQRTLMCERVRCEGWTVEDAAEAFGVSTRTVFRWLARYDAGEAMTDRSSAPHRVANRTPQRVVDRIEDLRRRRWTSTRIAAALRMATSTVCAVLARLGLHRLSRLEPLEPPNRYCRRHPGEPIHIDIKKLGRFKVPGHRVTGRRGGEHSTYKAGWEFVHVAIDDTTRLAYLEVLADEKGPTCVGFLERAISWFADHGVTVERVMTDNGTGYRSKVHAAAIGRLGIRHLRTRPYRPRTNGKAERFIQTMLRECAYGAAYSSSAQRRRALRRWLDYYNQRRPHSALGHHTPASRLDTAA